METINVLVIDDDPNIRKLLEELLTGKPNYNLMVVGDGKSAARCFAEQRVDVVLTDIHMPGFTGIELMADMKKLKFQPEILVMTANATPENVEKARAIGARSLVLKPFDNLEVVEEEIEKAVAAARESAAAAGGTPQTQGIEAAPSGEPQPEQPAPAPPAPPTPVPPQAAPAGAGGSTVKVERPEIDAWKAQLVGNETPAPAPAPAGSKAGGGLGDPGDLAARAAAARAAATGAAPAVASEPAVPTPPAPEPQPTPAAAPQPVSSQPAAPAPIPAPRPQPVPQAAAAAAPEPQPVSVPPPAAARPIVVAPAPQVAEPPPVAIAEPDASAAREEFIPALTPEIESVFRAGASVDAKKMKMQVPIVCLQTLEEQGAIAALRRLAADMQREFMTWSVSRGLVKESGKGMGDMYRDPNRMLEFIRRHKENGLYVLADFRQCLEDRTVARALREMVMEGETSRALLVLTAPRLLVPPELQSACVTFNWPESDEVDFVAIYEEVLVEVAVSAGRPVRLEDPIRTALLARVKDMPVGRARFEIAKELMARTRTG